MKHTSFTYTRFDLDDLTLDGTDNLSRVGFFFSFSLFAQIMDYRFTVASNLCYHWANLLNLKIEIMPYCVLVFSITTYKLFIVVNNLSRTSWYGPNLEIHSRDNIYQTWISFNCRRIHSMSMLSNEIWKARISCYKWSLGHSQINPILFQLVLT